MEAGTKTIGQQWGLTFSGRAHTVEEVAAIAEVGLRCVEINLLQGQEAMARLGELKQMARELGLSYLVHAPNEGDPRDLARLEGPFLEQTLRLLDGCAEIGAQLLTVHFWMDRRFIPGPVALHKAEILARMAREGVRRGVHISLENLSEDGQDLACALEISNELWLTLDVGHGELMCSRNRALELLERFPERVHHVHLHDNRGGDLVGDDLHLAIGEGCIDFRTFLGALLKQEYRGTVTLEVPLDALSVSLERVLRILQDLDGDGCQGGAL